MLPATSHASLQEHQAQGLEWMGVEQGAGAEGVSGGDGVDSVGIVSILTSRI